jgi:glycosyltransferase involved in cell wall biosynthesis
MIDLDPRLILDRAVAAEAAGRLAWPPGFWSWTLKDRAEWAAKRLGDYSIPSAPAPQGSCAHALPLKPESGRRRIGFLTQSFASCGGVETWFLSLATRLSEYDWLIAVSDPTQADAAAIAMLSSVGQVRVGPGAAQLVAESSDLLIAWGKCETPPFVDPRILVAHGCDQYTRRYVAERESWATHCVAVSKAAGKVFQKEPLVIHNGIDAARLAPSAGRDATRIAWGLVPGEIALVHMGRIADDKFPTAPAVAVRELGAPYRSVFVGSGSGSREFQEAVRRLDPLAVFRPPTPMIGDVLAAADVVLCCSPSEGFGLTAVEALAAGRSLVSTPVGVIPEIVERFGEVCSLVPIRHDAEQLASAVRQAHNRTQHAHAIADWLSADRMAAAWRTFLSPLPLRERGRG